MNASPVYHVRSWKRSQHSYGCNTWYPEPDKERPPPTVDVEAALTVLGRRVLREAETGRIGGTGTRRRIELPQIYLRHAYLPGVDLSGAVLNNVDLSEAILFEANLSEAILFEANLSGARLSRADLSGAVLDTTPTSPAPSSTAPTSTAPTSTAPSSSEPASPVPISPKSCVTPRPSCPPASSFPAHRAHRQRRGDLGSRPERRANHPRLAPTLGAVIFRWPKPKVLAMFPSSRFRCFTGDSPRPSWPHHRRPPRTARVTSTLPAYASRCHPPRLPCRTAQASQSRSSPPRGTPRQISELLNAEAFAEWQGIGFTAHATLHWRCDPAFEFLRPGASRLHRFLDKLGRWLKRQDIPVAFAWVNEVGREYGEHTHLVLHVPKPRRGAIGAFNAFKASLHAWDHGETEGFHPDQVDRFGKPWPAVKITGARYGIHNRRMRSGLCKYLLQGDRPEGPRLHRLRCRDPCCRTWHQAEGQCCPDPKPTLRRSCSLGPAARRAAGWTELRSLEDLHARLNPGPSTLPRL